MGNNMVIKAIVIGKRCTTFIFDHYNISENEKIEEGTILNAANESDDPSDSRVLECGENAFTEVDNEQIQTYNQVNGYEEDEEDEDIWTAQRRFGSTT